MLSLLNKPKKTLMLLKLLLTLLLRLLQMPSLLLKPLPKNLVQQMLKN